MTFGHLSPVPPVFHTVVTLNKFPDREVPDLIQLITKDRLRHASGPIQSSSLLHLYTGLVRHLNPHCISHFVLQKIRHAVHKQVVNPFKQIYLHQKKERAAIAGKFPWP